MQMSISHNALLDKHLHNLLLVNIHFSKNVLKNSWQEMMAVGLNIKVLHFQKNVSPIQTSVKVQHSF